MRVVNIDGTPWRASQAGWIAAREEVSRRVDRWARRRAAERALAPLGILACLVLGVRSLEVGAAWAMALSAVMLAALVVAYWGRR